MEQRIFAKLKKIKILIGLLQFISCFVLTQGLFINKHTWTYELKSIETKTSDPGKINLNFTVERVSRGVYALSGDFTVYIDIVEGDSNYVSASSFRSSMGNNDYKILPFQMPKTHFFDTLNSFYKNILMDTLKDCSNAPVFKHKFEPPLEKKTYKLNSCQVSQDGFPNYVQEGFYKIIITGTGEVDWEIMIIAEAIPA